MIKVIIKPIGNSSRDMKKTIKIFGITIFSKTITPAKIERNYECTYMFI